MLPENSGNLSHVSLLIDDVTLNLSFIFTNIQIYRQLLLPTDPDKWNFTVLRYTLSDISTIFVIIVSCHNREVSL